jgi:signal peptidase I
VNTPAGLLGDLLESSLESDAEARFAVAGNSMHPLVRAGDMVRVRRLGSTDPGLGDIVVVRGMPDGGLLLHRVVKVRQSRAVLRGDNTSVDNGEWERACLLGVVVVVERDGKPVWFGSGRWGRMVDWVVRSGSIWRMKRIVSLAARIVRGSRSDGRAGSA